MMNRMRRHTFAMVVVMIVIAMLPVIALAADYITDDGTAKTVTATSVVSNDTSWSTGWYVVDSTVTISSRITVSGTVNLILADGCTLTATKGVQVNSGNTLNIYGQSKGTGTLITGNAGYNAGIGGNQYYDGGNITINGGVVKAYSNYGAAIGGGQDGDNGSIAINGGTVIADGSYGAGIGGGQRGNGGTISITGGTVDANGGHAAGIGGGQHQEGGTINISGGEVSTVGGHGAGIGGGQSADGGNITISGGQVVANGGQVGAGIGGGQCADGGSILITGGNVQATGGSSSITWYSGGAGIGGGGKGSDNDGGNGGTVTITGGSVVATGGRHSKDDSSAGAGIGGGGLAGSGGEVDISGDADVTATGGADGAKGIGAGGTAVNDTTDDGTLTVNGVVVPEAPKGKFHFSTKVVAEILNTGDLPSTGDESNLTFFVTLFMMSAVVLTVMRKRISQK